MKEVQNYTYCNFSNFQYKYDKIHGSLSGLLCIFGIVTNILNTIVFTRKEMRWPTNVILTHIALIDICVMVEYIPFNYYYYFSTKKHINHFTYYTAMYTKFHAVFSQLFHFTSCCLILLLGIWRCIIIKNKSAITTWCTMRRTFYAILIIYFICPIICLPFMTTLKINSYEHNSLPNGVLLDKKDIESGNFNKTFIVNATIYYVDLNFTQEIFIHYGVILKIVPCLILTILSAYLIFLLISTKNKRKKLMTKNILLSETNSAPEKSNFKTDRTVSADRTSLMLTIILLTFLLTEFPSGIFVLLSAMLPKAFFQQCYRLGDIMDILALINSSINFFFYYTMSRQFRTTFQRIFNINNYSFCPQKNMGYAAVNKSTMIGDSSQLTHV